MRALVLGASGGCGQWLVRLAAEGGHEVRALVRAGSGIEAPEGVEVRRGDVLDAATLESALESRNAMLSGLGLRRAGRSPWAPLRSPADLTARVTRALLPAMARQRVPRLIAISAAGVAESRAQLSWPVQRLVDAGNVGVAYRDLAQMEALLAGSDRDWCAVRPVTLLDGAPVRVARAVTRYGLTSTIRRSEVAAWMVDQLAAPAPFRERRVMLAR